MKVSLNWLKEYVDIEISAQELAHILTMIGLEVEGLEPIGQSLGDIVVAQILEVNPHPNADKLSLCRINAGREKIQVVCGAPNLEVGSLVPLALPGTKLPDGTKIKENRIRGEHSTGMLLAEDEMGLTDDHTGIMVLPSDLKPGTSLPSAYPLSDWVLDISITPNRPDCASVIGIAREIAAATGKKLKPPTIKFEEDGPEIKELTSVTVEDPSGCPRYAAGIVQDIELRPSPFWMRYRLFQSGIRSINNVVDVTNYVLLEMGQPLHAFDYDRLREHRIVVRRAADGESFTTLDGEARILSKENLMICDGERAVALAGVMGGLNSEIFAGTRHVLIESAFFDPVTIRRGSKRLGLATEASYRFERGVDIEGVTTALKRAMALTIQFAGGTVAGGYVDTYSVPYTQPVINLRAGQTNRFLGVNLSKNEMAGYLRSLEMDVEDVNGNILKVKPPSFRVDVTREVDLIEEVARLSGYDDIPVTYPRIQSSEKGEERHLVFRDHIRSIMKGLGFTEIITYSFISPETADMMGADKRSPLRSFVRLLNPLTVDQSVMRTSLIHGVMSTVKANLLHDEKQLNLFEWGKVFIKNRGEGLPLEKISLAGVVAGLCQEKTWYGDERRVGFFDVKGVMEALLKSLGLKEFHFQRANGFPGFDSELSVGVYFGKTLIGKLGRASSGLREAYDLKDENTYLFEVDVEILMDHLSSRKSFQPITRFPAVYRDISIIVSRQTESAKIKELIMEQGGGLVESVYLFDLYEGKNLDPSEKALAFNVCYRSKKGTLDGEEVNRLHESVIECIRQETGGRLREG